MAQFVSKKHWREQLQFGATQHRNTKDNGKMLDSKLQITLQQSQIKSMSLLLPANPVVYSPLPVPELEWHR
jgi:hypothetical protein